MLFNMKLSRLIALVCILMILCIPAFSQTSEPAEGYRPGTVRWATNQPNGTNVTLDACTVYKIISKTSPAYIGVTDQWQGAGQIVVKFCASQDMHLGMIVEVTGVIATEGGVKLVSAATVSAYLKADESIQYIGPSKPMYTPLVWTGDKQSLAGTSCPTTPTATPNTMNPPGPHYYLNISDAKLAPDGEVVWLYNKVIYESDIDHGAYIIGADSSNDRIRVYSTTSATTADRAWSVIGVIGTHDGQRTISTDSGPDLDWHICRPTFTTYDSGHINWAKSQLDGVQLSLPQKIVTGVFPGYFYVSEPTREAGIRVISKTQVAIGKIINLSGATITTYDGEKCLTNVSVQVASNPITQIEPLGMTNRSLGAGNWGWQNDGSTRGQIGVENGIGLNNIGMLARIWGSVTEVDPLGHWYVIDDGTGLAWSDSAGSHTGVKISLGDSGIYLPCTDEDGLPIAIGNYVEGVTGISSCVNIDGVIHRMLRQIGAFGTRGPPWWPINKINRVGKPGI